MATEKTKLLSGASSSDIVPPDEMAELLHCTNFTEREIVDMYKSSTDGTGNVDSISRQDFARICTENGIRGKFLVERMWEVFDADSNGEISNMELVKGLNPLLRGTREQVAGMFFELYDVDGDSQLTAAEIISVYSDMINVSEQDKDTGLSGPQKRRILEWVEQQQRQNEAYGGGLDKDTFVKAVVAMEQDAGQGNEQSLCSPRSLFYIFLTAWFEVGTSFSLPAMGALSERIKLRFQITDTGIGELTSAYFFAAMVGPLIGGVFMDKYGPGKVIVVANIIVTLGATFQAMADGPEMYWLLFVGRLLLGFGGEITPFTTIEILGRLFPDNFGLMCGIRNLIQATSSFLAFVLLPAFADFTSDYENDNNGTSFALWMCVVLSVVSTITNVIVNFALKKERTAAEEISDQSTISKTMRAFSKATAPKLPDGLEKWKLPPSFFFASIGIKAQYFAPFAFTAFSIRIYSEKFHQSDDMSSFFTGLISLIAGLLGPVFGPWSDAVGQRSVYLAVFTFLSVIGFVILAVATDGSTPVWIASVLFALQYGFGDTVAYMSIRMIVGISRAGIGYGVYGIIGNFLATVVPIAGGMLLDKNDGIELVCWYFAALMLFSSLCWLIVLALEGTRSILELPADKVIETSDEDIQVAALAFVAGFSEG